MSHKITFIGPAGVGKTTLRKIFFEGENSQYLLRFALDPTLGKESIVLDFKDKIGVFDLAGQENKRWFNSEDKEVFYNTDVILCVIDVTFTSEEIIDFLRKVIEVRHDLGLNSFIYLVIHKIDLLSQKELSNMQKRVLKGLKQIKKPNYLRIEYTSITERNFLDTLLVFVDILQTTVKKTIPLEKLDFGLVKSILILLDQFVDQNEMDYEALKRFFIRNTSFLQFSEERLEELITQLTAKKILEISEKDDKKTVILTFEGKVKVNNLLVNFSLENLQKLEQDFAEIEPPPVINVPPFLGFLLADELGRTIMAVDCELGGFRTHLGKDTDVEVELIPMFINALDNFSREIYVIDLNEFKLTGHNLTMYIFGHETFMITFFLNPNVYLRHFEQEIQEFLISLINSNRELFDRAVRLGIVDHMEPLIEKSRGWLKSMNDNYNSMIINQEFVDVTQSRKLYYKLEEFETEFNKKFSDIMDDIKKLKFRLMMAIVEEDFDEVKEIVDIMKDLQFKYLT
ncbi:MAG: hypothetical protein ACFFCS_16035 [Candidatus Hodarchaeota archaeon]